MILAAVSPLWIGLAVAPDLQVLPDLTAGDAIRAERIAAAPAVTAKTHP